jgi:hypothetical protein
MFRKNYEGVLLRCLEKEYTKKVLKDLNDGAVGGHFARETITHKVLRDGYYWPTMFQDAHAYVRKCKTCQLSVGRKKGINTPTTSYTQVDLLNNGE